MGKPLFLPLLSKLLRERELELNELRFFRAQLEEFSRVTHLPARLLQALALLFIHGGRPHAFRYWLIRRLQVAITDRVRLMTVPGVGVLTATALVAFVGDVRRFRSGRDFAAYLGLTPRKHSSGFSRRLGSITKRGNTYVRMLLIHGARSALHAGKVSKQPDNLRAWALAIERRSGLNIAAVALVNKLARVCWRVWRDQRPFERRLAA